MAKAWHVGLDLLAIFCAILLHAASVAAWEQRKALIYGIDVLPAGVAHEGAYEAARASAWLRAVKRAAEMMPGKLDLAIRQLGLPVPQARMAIAALACPLDVATPEKTVQSQVRVFLKEAKAGAYDGALADPWRLLLEMALLWETEQALRDAHWPSENGNEEALKNQAELLRQLWQAAQANGSADGDGRLRELYAKDSAAILLMRAMSAPQGKETMAQADKAIELCLERESSGNAALWGMLAACGNYLRAQGHERLGQWALAGADLDTAIGRLRESGLAPQLEAEVLLTRAELLRKKGIMDEMCADYRAACALGRCQNYAKARREGICGS